MTEIEQLRKEINELRERMAVLESLVNRPNTLGPSPMPQLWAPPFTVTCGVNQND